jgi:hypothetical protein
MLQRPLRSLKIRYDSIAGMFHFRAVKLFQRVTHNLIVGAQCFLGAVITEHLSHFGRANDVRE